MKNLLSSATVPSSTGRQVGMVSVWKPNPGQEDSLAVTNSLCGVTENTTVDGRLLTQTTSGLEMETPPDASNVFPTSQPRRVTQPALTVPSRSNSLQHVGVRTVVALRFQRGPLLL